MYVLPQIVHNHGSSLPQMLSRTMFHKPLSLSVYTSVHTLADTQHINIYTPLLYIPVMDDVTTALSDCTLF